MDIIETTRRILTKVKDYILNSPWRSEYEAEIERVLLNIDQPCELAVVGLVKAGKSSFINALLGEDLTVVDVTEATATINYFRYGMVKDPEKPIKVVWNDGREEWQTRQFLDSLQGNTQEVLERAANIDHLEYFLPNELLEHITIVDTPGTNSVVKEHSDRLSDYLSQQNIQKSNNIKQRADAVIVLVGHVQKMGDEDVVNKFTDATNPFNFIGIMSKIDNEWEGKEGVTLEEECNQWKKRCTTYSERLNDRLHSIHPVSVLLHQKVEELLQNGRLIEIQSAIRQIKDKDYYDFLLRSSVAFEKKIEPDELESYYECIGLSLDARKRLTEGMPFTVFKVIADELYHHSITDAVAHLKKYAGMDALNQILQQQFFNRSRIMRCYSSLQKVHSIIAGILEIKIPLLRKNAPYKERILQEIDNMTFDFYRNKLDGTEFKSLLYHFVKNSIWTEQEYKSQISRVETLILDIENGIAQLTEANEKSEGLLLLQQNRDLFKEDEIRQLETIFGRNKMDIGILTRDDICQQKNAWAMKREFCSTDSKGLVRRKVIELALDFYDRLIDKI